ncbi:MAG: PBP1A family penicillin-binding protein [Myxococcales bacterium]|nr:PBP1A family penicillin-binding protein [Myxococcales bacterium]
MTPAANTRKAKPKAKNARSAKPTGSPSPKKKRPGPSKKSVSQGGAGAKSTAGQSTGKKPKSKSNTKKSSAKRRGSAGSGTRAPRTRGQWALLVAKWSAITGFLLAALGTAGLAGMLWYYGSDPNLPRIADLRDYKPAQVNRVVTADGKLIGEIFEKRRSRVTFEELPDSLVNAFISAEDKGFWKHEGIDYIGMVRAALVNVREGKKKQGASTITQQVVKNLLLTPERSFRRKFQEILLARRMEKALSKEEILMLYANEIFFGHGRYGVQEAARYYFGKNVGDLNVGESALLAGLPKGPNNYSPKKPKNHQRAKDRQSYVLQEMMHNGYLMQEEAQHWIDEPIAVVADSNPEVGSAPEFVELAKAELLDNIGEESLAESGAEVVVTVDLEVQELARKALQENLRKYDERKGYGWPIKKLRENKIKLELVRMAKRLPKKGPKKGKVYRAVVVKAHDEDGEITVDLGDFKAGVLLVGDMEARYNPDKEAASERFPRGSLVRVMLGNAGEDTEAKHSARQVVLAPGPEGAVVVIDAKTRRVRALIGGYDTRLAGFNRATMAKRQAGSTFKPFVYAAAIDSGDFTAASIVNDAPEVYDLWKPENYKKGAFAGPVRLRHALNKSINTVAIRVAHDIGPQRVRELANALGIQSELPEGLSLALGSGEVTPLELTNAFASFTAAGRHAPPRAIESLGGVKIEGPDGTQALRPEVAHVVVDMMRTVMTKGTGSKASVLGMDLAGKTGTSNNARDAWFVGMSPDVVIGVWVGFDDFRQELGSKEGGSRTALPVFIDIMKELGSRTARFARPPGVEVLRIDEASGLLAADGVVAGSYKEVFLEGSAPTEVAPTADEVGADDAILDQYGDFDAPIPTPEVLTPPVSPSVSGVP